MSIDLKEAKEGVMERPEKKHHRQKEQRCEGLSVGVGLSVCRMLGRLGAWGRASQGFRLAEWR